MHSESFGSEIKFEISSSLGVLCSGGPFENDSIKKITDCHFGNGEYKLSCIDTYGDGWHGGFV